MAYVESKKIDKENWKQLVIMTVSSTIVGILLLIPIPLGVFNNEIAKYIYVTIAIVLSCIFLFIVDTCNKKIQHNESVKRIYRINEHMASLGYTKEEIEERQAYLNEIDSTTLSEIETKLENEKEKRNQPQNMGGEKFYEPLNKVDK